MRPVTAVALAGLCASTALARPRLALDVLIDPAPGRRIALGTIAIRLENTTGAALDAIELWRFPARLGRPSPALNDYNVHWYFPRAFDPAAMEITEASVDGRAVAPAYLDVDPAGPGTIVRLPLATPLAPGATATVRARFRTTLPGRYGSFGCTRSACTLAGGFYPMPVELGPAGWDRRAPPARVDAEGTVRLAGKPGGGLLVAGRGVPTAPRDVANEHLDDAFPEFDFDSVAFRDQDVPYVVVNIDPDLRESTLRHRDVTVRYFHHGRPPPPETPPGVAGPYEWPAGEDLARLVLGDAREAIDLLHELGLELPAGTELRLVEAPLRTELAEAHGEVVLVSDRLFRLTPIDRFRKFHSFQLVRALFNAIFERRLRLSERPGDLAWAPDVAASWLVDLYTLRSYRRAEFAADVLRYAAFIPTIDRLLYAPQLGFSSAYFNTLDDPDPTRDHPLRFVNLIPRGKTIYEKLRDRVGDEGIARIGRALWQGTPVREAAAAEAGGPLDGFFAQWLGPYPQVDYRFELLGSERIARHRLRHRIRVYKVGEAPPVEPVELRATDWSGAHHALRWDGQGRETVLTVDSAHHLRSIELDPRGRLLQTRPGNDDPRLDDRRPRPVKFIYNNLGALFSFQTLTLDLSLDFTLERIHDLKNSLRFVLFHTELTQIGVSATYARLFGRKITPARLSTGASLGLSASRLEGTFGRSGIAPEPGTRFVVATGLGYDDRLYAWQPYRATAASLSASYTLTKPDGAPPLHQVSLGGLVERIQPLGPLGTGHALAMLLGVAATFGDLGEPSQMLSAGAPTWLRGYEPDELLGRFRVAGRLEYRHDFVHGLDWNFLHLLFLRSIGGALFAEAALISPCEGYAVGPQDVFADVGYSIRMMADWFGVSPTVFNLDFAVPLVRHARGCFQDPTTIRQPSTRAPIGVFVYFGPVW